MKNILIVVAHPDDEILGIGGTIYKMYSSGKYSISVCTVASEALNRYEKASFEEHEKQIEQSSKILGIHKRYDLTYPDGNLNNVPHLDLEGAIERTILRSEPDIIFTHHPHDTHNDHVVVSLACLEAFRIFQRRDGIKPISELHFIEIPSSTDWNITADKFNPNSFCEITEECLNKKLEALNYYTGVVRPFPHPRSAEKIKALAMCRGSQAGLTYAEATECAFSVRYRK